MDPRPVIIKLGSTMPSLAAQIGDFEDWTIRAMGLQQADVKVVNPTEGEALPSPRTVSAAIVTGSHAMVTDHEPWSERVAAWLRDALAQEAPVIAICYGHQLLAYALGGEVGPNPLGREIGTVQARLTSAAQTDPLFGGLGRTIGVHASHVQTVLRLPQGATLLATSELDRNFAFRVGAQAWGVQFHPEFTAEIGRAYVQAEAAALIAEGKDPDLLAATCTDGHTGDTILRRFVALAQARVAPLDGVG